MSKRSLAQNFLFGVFCLLSVGGLGLVFVGIGIELSAIIPEFFSTQPLSLRFAVAGVFMLGLSMLALGLFGMTFDDVRMPEPPKPWAPPVRRESSDRWKGIA